MRGGGNWIKAGEVTSTSLVSISIPNTAVEIIAVLTNDNAIIGSTIIPVDLISTPITIKYAADTSKELYYNGSKWKVTASSLTGKILLRGGG